MKVIKKVIKEGFIPEEDREFLDKEHEENIKGFEDAIKDNKKTAEETIPKEGETGKKIKSKALKAMHLEESLFTEDVIEDPQYGGLEEDDREALIDEFSHAINDVLEGEYWSLSYDELIDCCARAAEFVATHADGAEWTLIEK